MKNKHRKAGKARGYLDSLIIRGEHMASYLTRRNSPAQVTLDRIMNLVEKAQKYQHTITKNGKTRRYGISEGKATAIIDEFKQKHGSLSHMYLYEEGYITDLANILIRHMKAKHMSREQIISNLKSNVQLMVLSSHTIPEGILDEMFKSVESKMNVNELKLPSISTMKSLLENTKYQGDDNSAIKSAIFKGDKDEDSNDFSFITNKKSKGKIF